MVGGVIASRLFYELAVVGGTGLYDNVRGILTVTYLDGAPGLYWSRIWSVYVFIRWCHRNRVFR